MIRKVVNKPFTDDKNYVEMFGLSSTDDKPTAGIITGSKFTEVDTGDVYLFDEVSGTWAKVAAGWIDPET